MKFLEMQKVKSKCPGSEPFKRIAVFGDIHANVDALSVVVDDMKEQEVDRAICTGDIVGYAVAPKECLKIIRDLNCPVVMGNHDSYVSMNEGLKGINPYAMNAVLWTREHLDDGEVQWLFDLPLEQTVSTNSGTSCVGLIHSSLVEPGQWNYIHNLEQAKPTLQVQKSDVVFFGHTHVPSLFSSHQKKRKFKSRVPLGEGLHKLESGWKHLINPGSVGQPRDGDARASYALYDPSARTVEIRRVEYDIEAAQEKIISAGLPVSGAERLSMGR